MARLTNSEKHLLKFPPTETTWVCRGKYYSANDQKDVPCGVNNPGDMKWCWLCGTKKPAKPKLLWPSYVKACEKAGIQPGERLDQPVTPSTKAAPKRTRRKGS